jgi:AmmeMemoRadiSam system protein B
VPSVSAFATPLGEVPLDREAHRPHRDLPQVVVSDAAHAQEHSLEVQLPFLQTVLERLHAGAAGRRPRLGGEVAEVLECLWGGDETLIVISSDLSHFLPYAACARDRQRHRPAHRRPRRARPSTGLRRDTGQRPAAGRASARACAELLDLRNSGDTAGDKSRVVGYGAFSLQRGARCPLTLLGRPCWCVRATPSPQSFGLPAAPVEPTLPELAEPARPSSR